VVKNKVAPPFKRCSFDIIYGLGISKAGCILDEAVKLGLVEKSGSWFSMGVVEKSGSWFSMGEERLGQGRENAVQFLIAHPDIADRLEAEIRRQNGLLPVLHSDEETETAEAQFEDED